MKLWIVFCATVLAVLMLFVSLKSTPEKALVSPNPSSTSASTSKQMSQPVIVAKDLDIPWEIVFLQDRSMLVTERSGNIVRIFNTTRKKISVSGVEPVGEGGLLGMALHPQFEENAYIYLYATTSEKGILVNKVMRYRFHEETNTLQDKKTILNNIPASKNHDGGRMAFGPDGMLYITTGDAQQESLAQDTTSLAGKILRIYDDGTVPKDNPFGNAVYSYGHRNVQGIAWDSTGKLWATEHGRSGVLSGYDEINLIKKGSNYGWPIIQGDVRKDRMIAPVIHSGATTTWAPSGMTITGDTLLFVGLRGEALYTARINGNMLSDITVRYQKKFGRLRTVKLGPDGMFYILTNNTDGRGKVKEGDDRIIKLQL